MFVLQRIPLVPRGTSLPGVSHRGNGHLGRKLAHCLASGTEVAVRIRLHILGETVVHDVLHAVCQCV